METHIYNHVFKVQLNREVCKEEKIPNRYNLQGGPSIVFFLDNLGITSLGYIMSISKGKQLHCRNTIICRYPGKRLNSLNEWLNIHCQRKPHLQEIFQCKYAKSTFNKLPPCQTLMLDGRVIKKYKEINLWREFSLRVHKSLNHFLKTMSVVHKRTVSVFVCMGVCVCVNAWVHVW